MDLEQLRQDVASGIIDLDRLVEVIGFQQQRIEDLLAEIERLKEQNKKNPTQRLAESYSEKAEEKRQQRRGRKKKAKKS